MRACDGTFDMQLERFRASGTAATATTITTSTTTMTTVVNTKTNSENGNAEEEEEEDTETETETEEATSRKCECEGQLSLLNSCSSYKPAIRMTEMAQEDLGPSWNNLPSVILQEIFSYLPHETRIIASQVSGPRETRERQGDREAKRERESLVFSFPSLSQCQCLERLRCKLT